MKVLVVCSFRENMPYTDFMAPFIYEQVDALRKQECNVDLFFVKEGNYFKAIRELKKILAEISTYDLIHAHGGLCGFVAVQQKKCPVITTYHGSDINNTIIRFFSKNAIKKSKFNVFVSQQLVDIVKPKNQNFAVIPCGVDTDLLKPLEKIECKQKLGWDKNKRYILFSKGFNVKVKNYPLAKASVENIPDLELVEFKGYTREQVLWLYNACDLVLMTSFTEGSPQFIKEAMACNCPIISTDVGDVKMQIEGVDNCFILPYDPEKIKDHINSILCNNKRTNGREKLMALSLNNQSVTHQLIKVYLSI